MSEESQLRELQLVFLDEAQQSLEEAEETLLTLEQSGFNTDLVNKAFRLAHNFKGSSASVGYSELGRLAHRYEDILSAIKRGQRPLTKELISALLKCNDVLKGEVAALRRDGRHAVTVDTALANLNAALADAGGAAHAPAEDAPAASAGGIDWARGYGFFDEMDLEKPSGTSPRPAQKSAKSSGGKPAAADDSVKVPASRLDQLLNIIGELVVNQTILDDHRARHDTAAPMAIQAIGYMSKLIADVQGLSLSLRLVPIKPLFQKLRRTARDVASSLGKPIELVEEGEHCELDKSVIEKIADPLNHMIRNAIDHGVDSTAEREKSGKTKVATVRLSAITEDEHVKIIIADDGKGLNRERILAKATASGLVPAGAALTDQEVFALIFAPGFSTKDQVSDLSGRGVGMEVVKRAVDELKGSIKIDSAPNAGTRFEISLPLSLSIIGGMVVQANGQRFVIPVSQLVETIELNKFQIETITGSGRALNLRGEVLPVFRLGDMLQGTRGRANTTDRPRGAGAASRPALVTRVRGRKVSVEVDEIINQQRVVLKRLGREFEGLPGIVAGAVLSNGEPGLVLSLDGLITAVAS